MNMRWMVLAVVVSLPLQSRAVGAPDGQAAEVLKKIGADRGICVVLGDKPCGLAIDLARRSQLIVYMPLAGSDEVAAACRAAEAAGLYGTRMFIEKLPPGRIGLANDVADAVVVLGETRTTKEEILRVLRPEGKAVVGDKSWSKPIPAGVDQWTHHYHSPSNNPQSKDQVARAPYLTQFIAGPRYAPAPQAAVAAGGRLFMAFGHVAWHEREEPVLNTLIVINAYNGTELWRRPLTPGIMVDRSTMVATPSTLYLADEKSCKVLDAATGKQLDEIAPPAAETSGTFWKWMALDGGVLYALIGEDEPRDPDAKWRSTNHGWPWDGISRGYNENDYRWGFSKTLLAIDPKTKKTLWTRHEDLPIDGRTLGIKNGRIYFAHFGRYIACLDARTGKDLWRRTRENDPKVFKEIGPYRPGHGYIGGWKSTAYLKAADKALYFVGPQVEWLTAISADDGHVMWKHPAKDLHVIVRDEGLFTIGPQNSQDATKKLDPLTGKVLVEYKTARRACTRATGTPDGIFFRGHEGSGRLDIATGQVQWVSAMRPSCHVGVVVAFGHLYWLPWACDCNLQMFGAMSYAPAGDFPFAQEAAEADRLEVGQAASLPPTAGRASRLPPTVGRASRLPTAEADKRGRLSYDWPTHRADNARSAKTGAAAPESVKLLWQFAPKTSTEPTSPVAAGGVVFVGGKDGVVRALDAATGSVRWTAYTGGAVNYPPTIADGRAFVGSSDGWAYALDAATGRLLWRFRAGPADRKIPFYGSLISTWPVAGGVLVDGGTAYFAAGMNDIDGAHVYALDAATGKIRWQNNSAGHLDAFSSRGVTCQGEMLLNGGQLFLAGGNTVSPAVFDASDGKCLNPAPAGMGSHAPRGRELRLAGGLVTVSGQPLYSQPGMPVYDPSLRWTEAVVHAKNADLSFHNRNGAWTLVARDPQAKKDLWSQPLPSEPVRWGIAIDAQGRIVVTLRDGKVMGFGS